ncbi:MAG: 16S rRNA (guanine(966)-N(2))-methyltransferase RsmD [Desulfuromonadales bacterium]|jgi:16S rRNA (guanine966-N2)-methyltransferase|nr:16S rRNA (guanine(966)-N(2))-methyltransferase RsmD [Desulfuromonadales bacterium]
MRVIAGTSRGRRLAIFEGRDVRPTPDRVREALFSILQSKLGSFAELRVLDLFAGSGALGIEALSRGASSACLVEKSPAAEKIIRENLNRCQLSDKTKLIIRDAWLTLPGFEAGSFDLVFLDPPFAQELAKRALIEVDRLELLSKDGIICAETGADEILPESIGKLQRIDQRRYGTIMINFYS